MANHLSDFCTTITLLTALGESGEHEENIVIEEFEKGYRMKDKVIRHAKVVVSK